MFSLFLNIVSLKLCLQISEQEVITGGPSVDGWFNSSKPQSLMTVIAFHDMCTGALSWRSRTPLVISLIIFPWWPPLKSEAQSHRHPSDTCLVLYVVHKQNSLQIQKQHCHYIFNWWMCLKLSGRQWAMMFPLHGFLFCFRIPVTDPNFITCYDSWEKCFWICFIKSKILLRKLNPVLLLYWSQKSLDSARTDLQHTDNHGRWPKQMVSTHCILGQL